MFALESHAWTGGLGLYAPDAGGWTPARAYLMSAAQFSDVAAQEMYRETGSDLDLGRVLAEGRATFGPGRYETLACAGNLHEHPVLTFTCAKPPRAAELNGPAPDYLRHLASGLAEAHGWDARRIAAHLARRPGAADRWRAADIADLIGSPAAVARNHA
ncbi:histone deacetylase [Streptodolium elevatio]